MSPQSKSTFWSASAWKARLKRGNSNPSTTSTGDEFHSAHSSILTDQTDTTETPSEAQTEICTQYSPSVYSDEDVRSTVLPPPNDQKDDLDEYYLVSPPRTAHLFLFPQQTRQNDISRLDQHDQKQMAPNRRHSRPYAVSSGEWVLVPTPDYSPTSVGKALLLDDLNEVQLAYSLEGVLKVFIKVYAMAKVMQAIFLAFGVELDDSVTGLLHWINRAEIEVRTGELAVLIEVVENLFYALYSRVIIEMAGIELCALFKVELLSAPDSRKFRLPDANHMYRILLACKDNLDNYNICELLQEGIVHKWQEVFLRRLAEKELVNRFNPDHTLGYRQFALNVVSEPCSAYAAKWVSLIPFFPSIPKEILIIMSEKWFTVKPKATLPGDVPSSQLPFLDLKRVNPAQWEKEIILDYRLATLGKLEGRSIGDERRDDPKIRLVNLTKYHKCICSSNCSCARECTYDVESDCPCSERHLRLMTARLSKGPGRFDFPTRANTAGRACWEGLARLRRGVSDETILLEWSETFAAFELEIQKERWGKQA